MSNETTYRVIKGQLCESSHGRATPIGNMSDYVIKSPGSTQVYEKQGGVDVLVAVLEEPLGQTVYDHFYKPLEIKTETQSKAKKEHLTEQDCESCGLSSKIMVNVFDEDGDESYHCMACEGCAEKHYEKEAVQISGQWVHTRKEDVVAQVKQSAYDVNEVRAKIHSLCVNQAGKLTTEEEELLTGAYKAILRASSLITSRAKAGVTQGT